MTLLRGCWTAPPTAGEVQVPLTGLLISDDNPPLPALTISSPAGGFPPVITETAPGIHAEVVLHGTQPQDTVVDGITVDTQERLLPTTPAGVVRADLSSGALGWAAPIPGCRGSALQRADGSILVICDETVLRWDGHDCQILAGGFTGGTSLLPGPRRAGVRLRLQDGTVDAVRHVRHLDPSR